MADTNAQSLDTTDIQILRILSENPRMSYAHIADRLGEAGVELSSEGVRYRVSKILESTDTFFLIDPEKHEWEMVRLAISVKPRKGAKETVKEQLSSMNFWLVCRGIGTYDIYAVAFTSSIQETDRLVTGVEVLENVESVEHSIESSRRSNVNNYYTTSKVW